ncbi:MAG: WD40 repeat domain-containing protein [Acidobacteria bacterium]|nr:MAG: WD40 repeat domain-containing protein [Acidobacteriota bacterium]
MLLCVVDEAPGINRQAKEETTPNTFSCLTVSPDGRLMALGSIALYAQRGAVSVSRVDSSDGGWNSGCEPVLALAFSPDSRLLASAHAGLRPEYGLVKVWDVGSGRVLRTFLGHHGDVRSVCFSADGRSVISAGSWIRKNGKPHGEIAVWDVASGSRRLALEEKDGIIDSLAVSTNDVLAGAVRVNDTRSFTRLWDMTGRVLTPALTKRPTRIDGFAFSTNGRRLAVGGPVSAVRRPVLRNEIDAGFRFFNYEWSGGSMSLIDAENGNPLLSLGDFKGPVRKLAFSPDGRQLAALAEVIEWRHRLMQSWPVTVGSEWRILDVESGEQRLAQDCAYSLEGVAFVPGSPEIITCSSDNAVRIWDSISGRVIRTLKKTQGVWTSPTFQPAVLHTSWPVALAFQPGEQTLSSVRRDGLVQSWDLRNCEESLRDEGYWGTFSSAAFSRDAQLLATAKSTRTPEIEVRNLQTGVAAASLKTPQAATNLAFLSPHTLLIAFAGGRTELFDIANLSVVHAFDAGEKVCYAGCWIDATPRPGFDSASKARHWSGLPAFATGHPDGSVRFWDRNGRVLFERKIQAAGIGAIAVSQRGDNFYTGDELGAVKSWDVGSMQRRRTFRAGGTKISDICLSESGGFLAAADVKNTVRVWDTVEERELLKVQLDLKVSSLALSADGSRLAVGTWNNQITLLETREPSLLNVLTK